MKIINLGIVAHVDAGKTTLTEQLLFQSGATRSAGSVDQGTARTDFMQVERERGISVRASAAALDWNGVRLNLIDTPGHVDFAAEVERSLRILDGAVLVISSVEGLQPQTELLWEALAQTATPCILFLNKADRAGSASGPLLEQLRKRLGRPLLLFTELSGEESRACTVRARSLSEPDFFTEAAELAAGEDDAFLERYLSGAEIPPQELSGLLGELISKGRILPVLTGSAAQGVGVRELLDLAAAYLTPAKNRTDDQLSALVYKITHDKTMGRIAHVRLFGGAIRSRDGVTLQPSGEPGKVTQVRRYSGGRYTDIGEVRAGDVAALCGLSAARIYDVIGLSENLADVRLSAPLFRVQAIPAAPEELYPLSGALAELSAEDPQLDVQFDPDAREIDVSVTGKIQLEVLTALIQERYGLSAAFSTPTVIYKETPAGPGNGFDAYTMPKPCWAVVSLDIEPLPRGAGFQYSAHVPNDKLFYRYQNHIEIAVRRALKQGLFNWEVVDLRVTLADGEHHTVHTHPMDFFLATPIAFMKGLQNCGSTLLEPMQLSRIIVPEEYSGRVIGDLVEMRGSYDAPVIQDGSFSVEALLPVSASMDYGIRLAAQTSGRGLISTRFAGYQACPPDLGQPARRHGVNPLDRDRWILTMRSAMQG